MPGQPPPVAYIDAGKLHSDIGNRPHKSGQDKLRGMAETIRLLGVLVPLWIRPHPSRPGHYIIKDGHLRFAAGQMAGLASYPCTLRRPSPLPGGELLVQVVMQTQREDWSPVELAIKLGQLRDGPPPMTQAEIARYTGLGEATVSYHMELLDLDGDTLQKVRSGDIPVGAAHEAVKAARASGLLASSGPSGRTVPPRRSQSTDRKQYRKPPPHWTATHPLAADAHARCDKARHEAWTRLGKVACGECWEAAVAAHALAGGAHPRPVAVPAVPFKAAG
jgi:ParB/RepB/Spo0J family partition protein